MTASSPAAAGDPLPPDTVPLGRAGSSSQLQLMWVQFKRHRMAMVSAVVLVAIYLIAGFCEFLAPFSPIAFNPRYTYAPPQQLHLFDRDAAGQLIWRPHVNGYKVTIDPVALRRTFIVDDQVKHPVGLFVASEFALVNYKCTDYYHPEAELSIAWNDPAIGIDWPMTSAKNS